MKNKIPFSFKKTFYILQCKSTMNLIRDLSSEEEGITVVSLRQFAGRGRKGNEWLSHPGGLYFSFLVKPTFHPRWNEKLYLLTTKAVENVIQSYLPSQKIEFKIPNDVLVNGKKIAGVLIDAKAEASKNLYLIIGIGINISNTVPHYATSLQKEGILGVSLMEVLEKFQRYFEKSYDDWINQI